MSFLVFEEVIMTSLPLFCVTNGNSVTLTLILSALKGTFVSAGGSWNLIAFTDLRVCLGEFIDRDHGPVDPA